MEEYAKENNINNMGSYNEAYKEVNIKDAETIHSIVAHLCFLTDIAYGTSVYLNINNKNLSYLSIFYFTRKVSL